MSKTRAGLRSDLPVFFYLCMKGKRCTRCTGVLDYRPCFARWTKRIVYKRKGWLKVRKVRSFMWTLEEAVCGGCIMDAVISK
jgi:hypothetical protein